MKILQSRAFFLIKYKGNDKKTTWDVLSLPSKTIECRGAEFFRFLYAPSPISAFCFLSALPHLNYEFSWQTPLWESHEIHQTESRLQICEYWEGLRIALIYSVLQNFISQKELFLSMRLRLSNSSKRSSCWNLYWIKVGLQPYQTEFLL